MTDASTSLDMSTGLQKVAERAKREPAARFNSLAHLIDEDDGDGDDGEAARP